jgi:hypothetical protein
VGTAPQHDDMTLILVKIEHVGVFQTGAPGTRVEVAEAR